MKVFDVASATFISQNAQVAVKWACNERWGAWNRPVRVGKQKSILGSNLGQIKGLKFAFGCIAVVGYSQRRRLLCAKCTRELGNQSMSARYLRKMGRIQCKSSERVQWARIPSSPQPFAAAWTTKTSSLICPRALTGTTSFNRKGIGRSSRAD